MLKKGLLLLSLILFGSSYYYTEYVPVLMNRTDLEASVEMAGEAKPITDPGKLCLYQQWVLLVEKYKGIHLIDNSDPSNPVNRDFLRVPGCRDVVVGNGILYADNAVDLVGISVDFSALTASVVCRKKAILPEVDSPEGYIPSKFKRWNRPDNTEIVAWVSVTKESESSYYNYE